MRVTEKLLLGIACSALCLTLSGCSDDDNWSPTSDMSAVFTVGAFNSDKYATLLVSNAQNPQSFKDRIYLSTNTRPYDPNAQTTTPGPDEGEGGEGEQGGGDEGEGNVIIGDPGRARSGPAI